MERMSQMVCICDNLFYYIIFEVFLCQVKAGVVMMSASVSIIGIKGSERENFLKKSFKEFSNFTNSKLHISHDKDEDKDYINLKIHSNNDDLFIGVYSDFSDFYNSDIIYIFIDGDYFMAGSKKQKCRNIKRNVSRFITPYISSYPETNNGKQPLLFFAVTKCFKVLTKNRVSEVHSILRETFSNVFDNENKGYCEPCAIFMDIDKRYAINIPFLTGMYFLSSRKRGTSRKNIIRKLLEIELYVYRSLIITDFRKKNLSIKIDDFNQETAQFPDKLFRKIVISNALFKTAQFFSKGNQQKVPERRNIMLNMENFNTRFTALGLSGSGKTCYVMGMYSEMASGIRGWTLCTANADADRINRQLMIMESTTGGDRFPTGTPEYVFDDYEFKLYFRNSKIMNFNWVDYAGGILKESSLGAEAVELLESSIICSSTLFIFVDGDLFCEETFAKRKKNIRRKCSFYIQPRIANFVKHQIEKNEDSSIPPIVFVITKADFCMKYTTLNEIKEILKDSFSSIFYDENALAYVTAISLGEDIADNDYSGEIDPINIQTPFFIGIAHDFARICGELTDRIDNDIARMNSAIEANENAIAEEKNEIRQSQNNIENNQKRVEEKEKQIKNERKRLEQGKLEFERLRQEVQRQLDNAESERKRINDLSTGVWIFNGIKKWKNKAEIEKANDNLKEYNRKKANAQDERDGQEKENKNTQNKIDNANNEKKNAKQEIENENNNISNNLADIERRNAVIEECKKNISENTEKRKQYQEMLFDVLEELKKQSDDKQFITIKCNRQGGKEVEFSTENIVLTV